MNAYRIDIWKSVEHNGKFVANINRVVLIHARNETEAKSKISLQKETVQNLPQLEIKVSNEVIYSCERIGTVTIERFYVYSDGRTPISVKEYQAQLKKELEKTN